MSGTESRNEQRVVLAAVAGMLLIAAALHTVDGRLKSVEAQQAQVQVTAQQSNYGSDTLIYDMSIPIVSGFANTEFERELNGRIAAQAAQDKAAAESYAKDFMQRVSAGTMLPYDCVFNAWYEAKCAVGILSLRITTFFDNGGTGMPHTVYYNADIAKCEMLTLDDLFINDGYRERINCVIEDWIENNPDSFGEPFAGVSKDTQFFVSGGRLFITFAKYEIAAGALGEPELEIPKEAFYDLLKPVYRALIGE
jgi:hypothetical protein